MKKHTTKSEPKYVIYGLHCTCHPEEGVRYVGQTSTTPQKRLYQHVYMSRQGADYPVSRWIRKHGQENIEYEILEELEDAAGIDARESWWIEEKSTMVADGGLNLWPGGKSVRGYQQREDRKKRKPMSNETREKHRLKLLGRFGENSPRSVLTEDQVTRIKRDLWRGLSANQTAKKFGVSYHAVQHIKSGKTWPETPWPIGPRRRALGERKH